jgi:hypothetical protein
MANMETKLVELASSLNQNLNIKKKLRKKTKKTQSKIAMIIMFSRVKINENIISVHTMIQIFVK